MANWLSAAANALKRSQTDEPQTYELRCSCGRIVGGVRAATYQQISCPSCRQRLFVLPASVYPRPKAARPRPKTVPKPAATVTAQVADVEDSQPASAGRGRRKSVLATREKPRALVTPVRLALVALACVTVVTVWGVSRSRSLQQAELDFGQAVHLGREALERGDLEIAATHFDKAAQAADLLGKDDPPAQAARQLARETTSAVNLLEDSPSEALQEAVQTHTASESAWRETFQYRFRDQWLILDTSVSLATQSGTTSCVLEFPVFSPNGTIEADLLCDSPLLRSLAAGDGSRRIILAGQLSELKPEAGNPNRWHFVLNPRTAFVWSNPTTYELVMGQPLDGGTRMTLADQTRTLNLQPWPTETTR